MAFLEKVNRINMSNFGQSTDAITGYSNNRYFQLTVKKLLQNGLMLSPEAAIFLRGKIQNPVVKNLSLKRGDNRLRFRTRIGTTLNRGIDRGDNGVDVFVKAISKLKKSEGNLVVTVADVKSILRKLCPIWPFC